MCKTHTRVFQTLNLFILILLKREETNFFVEKMICDTDHSGYPNLKYPLGKFIVLHQTAISVLSTMIQRR